ncbi:4662_t:CDS:10 [Funneliformis mosseae]|uniref:4662_t:CDS:1 n=1 Tax=Funneliformis mosseae TaxID=27381 RepID=A0A9N9AH49_FUNMO|nr:4662_t:CDS:10 [Funneliformis mosseae]
MSSNNDSPDDIVVAKFNARWISYSHTLFAYVAFFSALVTGCSTHYYQIVKNEHGGYPEEWFPSVSAATGDWYPARSIFQIFIAVAAGPRFLLIYLFYLITDKPNLTYPKIHAIIGVIRAFSCGGWVYITSSDDHYVHDIAMIVYLVTTLPWMLGTLAIGPDNKQASKWRKLTAIAFFGTLVPMFYFYFQHKVHRVVGAYTIYAFFEWSLILYDIAFDALSLFDFNSIELRIVNINPKEGVINVTAEKSEKFKEFSRRIEPIFEISFWSNLRGFLVDTYLAFMYWSMLTSLALTIWYFPLWYMGISGFESFLLVTIAPSLLGIGFIRKLINLNHGVFHLLSLVGIAAYLFTDPVQRLIVVSTGVAIATVTWTSMWIENRNSAGQLERYALTWCLGLILSNVVKMAWWTNNPIWPIMHKENGGWNHIGLFFGVLASLDVMLRKNGEKTQINYYEQITTVPGSWFMAASGFGSLLFALHSLLTDSSTIIRWVYDGYPNTGPHPIPWGVVTIIAMSLGLFLSPYKKIVISKPWYVIGCVSCAYMYYYPAWNGYYGGLVLTVYLMSLVPTFIGIVVQHPPGRTFLTAMMIYNIFCLAHVWVVAYAFVPAGEYMREHTDYVLFAMMTCIGLGIRNASTNYTFKHLQLNSLHLNRSLTRGGLAIMILLGCLVSFSRLPFETPTPYHPEQKIFTAGIWTIHFALDNDMWASLLESDTGRIMMGNRDFTQFLAEDLNMYSDYGPGPSKHTWGCAMLSKFPILASRHYLLPSPVGELACAIHATLDVYGQKVDVIVSHNGQEEDELDRKLQTEELARIMRESENPIVFLGYVVTTTTDEIYSILINDGNVFDIDETDYDRWCEYIAYRGVKRIGYARVSHGRITDTEIQLGKFQIVENYNPKTWQASEKRVKENKIDRRLRFPEQFKGEGVRGHRYHVFDEPRYYN